MTKFLYYYQLERFETTGFVKRVLKNYFKKRGSRKLDLNSKARFVLIVALATFILISSALIFFTPYYIAAPTIACLWLIRFLFLMLGNLAYRPLEIRSEKKKVSGVMQKMAS